MPERLPPSSLPTPLPPRGEREDERPAKTTAAFRCSRVRRSAEYGPRILRTHVRPAARSRHCESLPTCDHPATSLGHGTIANLPAPSVQPAASRERREQARSGRGDAKRRRGEESMRKRRCDAAKRRGDAKEAMRSGDAKRRRGDAKRRCERGDAKRRCEEAASLSLSLLPERRREGGRPAGSRLFRGQGSWLGGGRSGGGAVAEGAAVRM